MARALLTIARLGQAQAFFGNVYEAVVRVPHQFAHNRALAGRQPFHLGSPTLYFVPAGPITLAALVGALVTGAGDRRWLATSTGAAVSAGALTAYVVTRINKRLFMDVDPPTPEERDALLNRWYQLNAIRIALTGTAWFAAVKASR